MTTWNECRCLVSAVLLTIPCLAAGLGCPAEEEQGEGSFEEFTYTAADGQEIVAFRWLPAEEIEIKGVVLFIHGLVEHGMRYERFARELNDAGYVAYGSDLRGHGETAGSVAQLGLVGEDSWNGILADQEQLADLARQADPDLPIFLFAHSMGHWVGRRSIQTWSDPIGGIVLSGGIYEVFALDASISMYEELVAEEGRDAPADELMEALELFNNAFEPAETDFDWLSRDADEVRKYIDDPTCGFTPSNGFVLDSLYGQADILEPANEALTAEYDPPVLVIAGSRDAAGSFGAGPQDLVDRYTELGLSDVELSLYEDARHELLNETNRDEVHSDVIAWLDQRVD